MNSKRHTAATYTMSATEKHIEMKSGSTARMHSTVPQTLQRV